MLVLSPSRRKSASLRALALVVLWGGVAFALDNPGMRLLCAAMAAASCVPLAYQLIRWRIASSPPKVQMADRASSGALADGEPPR
jgi:hypothetical protein